MKCRFDELTECRYESLMDSNWYLGCESEQTRSTVILAWDRKREWCIACIQAEIARQLRLIAVRSQ